MAHAIIGEMCSQVCVCGFVSSRDCAKPHSGRFCGCVLSLNCMFLPNLMCPVSIPLYYLGVSNRGIAKLTGALYFAQAAHNVVLTCGMM